MYVCNSIQGFEITIFFLCEIIIFFFFKLCVFMAHRDLSNIVKKHINIRQQGGWSKLYKTGFLKKHVFLLFFCFNTFFKDHFRRILEISSHMTWMLQHLWVSSTFRGRTVRLAPQMLTRKKFHQNKKLLIKR